MGGSREEDIMSVMKRVKNARRKIGGGVGDVVEGKVGTRSERRRRCSASTTPITAAMPAAAGAGAGAHGRGRESWEEATVEKYACARNCRTWRRKTS